ncbi:MAG: GlsB/YeaQ/YmgE family stress response membrane protein [Polyangiaceae bacterium]
MGILSWIVFGFVAGALAKLLMPGKDPGGCIVTVILGVVGASLGGFLATRFGLGTVTGFNMKSLGVAVVGALVILVAYRIVRRA